jgi:uncharacterized protein YdeI (YjbR/CyaY-like superfamily)
MVQEPTFFPTEADFRRWLEVNHATAPELLVGFWKKSSGKASIELGEDAYTIRFTPRRNGSIWSKVNVERFEALKAAGQMTPAGEAAYERDKHRSGLYSYEKPLASLTAKEERLFRKNKAAWADWQKRPPGYRKTVLGWIAGAKRPETRAKRLSELIACSAEGRRLPQYDWQKNDES